MNARLATRNLTKRIAPLNRYAHARRVTRRNFNTLEPVPYEKGVRAIRRMRSVQLVMTRLGIS